TLPATSAGRIHADLSIALALPAGLLDQGEALVGLLSGLANRLFLPLERRHGLRDVLVDAVELGFELPNHGREHADGILPRNRLPDVARDVLPLVVDRRP